MGKAKKTKAKAPPPEVDKHETPPEGAFPVFLSTKSVEKYGLSAVPETAELVLFKLLDISEILNDIQNVGVLCDFHALKPGLVDLKVAGETNFMCLPDAEKKYGKNWIACLSLSSRKVFQAKIDEATECQNMHLEELLGKKYYEHEAEMEKERLRLERLTYKDAPRFARDIVSSTFAETVQEIVNENIYLSKVRKPRLVCHLSRLRKFFGSPTDFHAKTASENESIEFRSHKDPKFGAKKMVRDLGIQCSASFTASWLADSDVRSDRNSAVAAGPTDYVCFKASTQTKKARKLFSETQYDESSASLGKESRDKLFYDTEHDNIFGFVSSKGPVIEKTLQENINVNPFSSTIGSFY